MTLTAVLTRPGGVVEPLRLVLEQRGVDSFVQPLINIASIAVEHRELITLYPGDICIFISVNAVEQGLANLAPQLRELGCPILAVGRATASAISAAGFDVSVPSQADSEGLLGLDILHDVKGKQVVIVKGEGAVACWQRRCESVAQTLSAMCVIGGTLQILMPANFAGSYANVRMLFFRRAPVRLWSN